MLTQFSSVSLRSLLLLLLIATFGCSSATYIRAKVTDNPLDKVAEQAKENWSIDRPNPNNLHISDAWPFHSALALGYSASHANLTYDTNDLTLDIQYYFQSNQLLMLFIPFYLDAEPGFVGGALKPTMTEQINSILRWSGATVVSRRAGDKSEPFPSKVSAPSPSN